MAKKTKLNSENFPLKILIVEDDAPMANLLESSLSLKIEDAEFKTVADGEEAWTHAGEAKYDLIVLDWKLPTTGGLALLNRFRSKKYYRNIPILICSGYLEAPDYCLIDELPMTDFVQKPFNPFLLTRKIRDLHSESLWNMRMRDKLEALFSEDDQPQKPVLHAIQELMDSAPKPLGVGIASLRKLRQAGRLDEALKLALNLQEKHEGSLAIQGELGKIYLQTDQLKDAKKILTSACEKSPRNLDRICDLGAANLRSLDLEEAAHLFRRALEIDEASENAQGGLKLATNMEGYFKFSNPRSIPTTFAGLLNAIGVSLVRSKNFASGVDHYKSAMRYVYDDSNKAKLAFNLGLGFLRWGNYQQAYTWLVRALEILPHYEKPLRYLSIVESKLVALGLTIPSPSVKVIPKTLPQPEIESLESQELLDSLHEPTQEETRPTPYQQEDYKELAQELVRKFPEMRELFQLQVENGIHVPSQVPEIRQLIDEYSDKLCRLAIQECIRFNKVQATDLSHYLKGYSLLN